MQYLLFAVPQNESKAASFVHRSIKNGSTCSKQQNTRKERVCCLQFDCICNSLVWAHLPGFEPGTFRLGVAPNSALKSYTNADFSKRSLAFGPVQSSELLFYHLARGRLGSFGMCEKCVKVGSGSHTFTTFLVGKVPGNEALPHHFNYSIICSDLQYLFCGSGDTMRYGSI